jgi:hypothetical protein
MTIDDIWAFMVGFVIWRFIINALSFSIPFYRLLKSLQLAIAVLPDYARSSEKTAAKSNWPIATSNHFRSLCIRMAESVLRRR